MFTYINIGGNKMRKIICIILILISLSSCQHNTPLDVLDNDSKAAEILSPTPTAIMKKTPSPIPTLSPTIKPIPEDTKVTKVTSSPVLLTRKQLLVQAQQMFNGAVEEFNPACQGTLSWIDGKTLEVKAIVKGIAKVYCNSQEYIDEWNNYVPKFNPIFDRLKSIFKNNGLGNIDISFIVLDELKTSERVYESFNGDVSFDYMNAG